MDSWLIHAARALTPEREIPGREITEREITGREGEEAAILIEEGRISAIGRREEMRLPKHATEVRATKSIAIPGFVDVHIHGAGGRDVMEATAEALGTVCETVARHGTTTILATPVSAPLEKICASLAGIAAYIRGHGENGHGSSKIVRGGEKARARIAGIHLEGPFISAARRGVHPLASLAKPSVKALKNLLEAGEGYVKILTLAPELEGAEEVIAAATAAGVVVALGHTDATYAQAQRAIALGARHAAHVFNAMRPFSHRETGVLGAVLTTPEVTAEVIADGVHVDGPALALLLAAKGANHVILVSDGTAATGMPDGTYKLGDFEFTLSGGVCRNAEGKLAGSALTLERAVQRMAALGLPLRAAVGMATENPARRIHLAQAGRLSPGADADLVLLNANLEIERVMLGGVWSG